MQKIYKKYINNFFNDLSIASGNMDMGSIRQMYYSLVKHVVKTSVEQGRIRLPDFGEFYIKEMKKRHMHNVNRVQFEEFPMIKMLKFRPEQKLKAYLRDKSRNSVNFSNAIRSLV